MEAEYILPNTPILAMQLPMPEPPRGRSLFALELEKSKTPYLLLPPLFVQTYLNPIPRVVTLANTVDGRRWVIVMRQDMYGVHFGSGWAEFRDAYRIRKKYILNFSHDNDTHFEVAVVNKDGLISTSRPLDLQLGPPPPPHARLMPEDSDESDSDSDDDAPDVVSFVGLKPVTKCGRCGNVRSDADFTGMKAKRKMAEPVGPVLAQNTYPYCPFFYTSLASNAAMSPYKMRVPDEFAKTCLSYGKNMRKLRVKGKGIFVVQVQRKLASAVITNGFSTFITDCGLEVMDIICVEECRHDKRVWNVTIRKSAKDLPGSPVVEY